MHSFLFSLLVFLFVSLPTWSDAKETFTFGRFGTVAIYHEIPHPSQVMLLVSGEQGWNQEAENVARALASLNAIVVGIDLPQYLTTLSAAAETCSYPGGDFDALSKFVQQKYGFPTYVHPVLVGYGDGATLAYATLAQAPPDMFQGVISLGFCPEFAVKKPLCEWNSLKWESQPQGNHFRLLPGTALAAPWIALHGDQDQVCRATAIETFVNQVNRSAFMLVPQVGHDFSAPTIWLPQFTQAFARLVVTADHTSPPDALADLPLVEIPATGPSTDTLAVVVSGDGGWATIDREVGNALASLGIPVIGLNSLKYFWTRRTPDGAAQDLERIICHYLTTWKKDKAVLIGYSRGADVLPFMANRLPQELITHTPVVVLLGPTHTVDFEFHLTDWLPGSTNTATHPVLPEVQKLIATKMLCVYGEEEVDTLCQDLDPRRATVIRLKGGHHFDGNYQAIAETIVRAANVTAR
jgi:type IV secretory pathway VirJ component